MSDTCIVCLGDLSSGYEDLPTTSTTTAKSPPPEDAVAQSKTTDAYSDSTTTDGNVNAPELIAHIQPCGHDLHNECLTPWVERANSCPICRANFHLVELMDKVGGTVISSYPVADRTQVAELDSLVFLEQIEEDEEDQPCQACGEDDNEDVLMYCDGCQKMWHTYCVDLQEVPYGQWFCDNCRAQRDVDFRQEPGTRPSRSSRRRTRGQQRRQRGHQQAHDSGWNEVWQSVWSRINLDLDFPYEDDDTSAAYMRRHRQRRITNNRIAHDAWLRRMQVAELHGAGNRFRETEPTLASSPGGSSTPANRNLRSSPPPQAESADELMAWHAFDQARASSNEATASRKKKRKSRTPSPEAEGESAAPSIKRRRISQPNISVSEEAAPSIPPQQTEPNRQSPVPRRFPANENAGHSFLQSLLQEVEGSSTSSNHAVSIHRPSPRTAGSPAAEQQSPRPSSPALSPLPSNHSSPRATSATPPPPSAIRPSSPTGLTSRIQPVFPLTEYSPLHLGPTESRENFLLENPPPRPNLSKQASSPTTVLAQPRPKSRIPRILDQSSPTTNGTRSHDTSPTRSTMSLTAKSDVQKLVSAALKPHYNDQKISKDEYTIINRDVSRMLYDKIGDFEALDVNGKAKWEKVAGEEVNRAVTALKAQA